MENINPNCAARVFKKNTQQTANYQKLQIRVICKQPPQN